MFKFFKYSIPVKKHKTKKHENTVLLINNPVAEFL